jgi:aerobic carbon-monoxide dehydrogenase medium subunit
MKLPAFDYACPATLDEAVALLASRDDAKALAGGQSLVPMMAFRVASPSLVVDLRKLAGLRRIEIAPGGVRLGAMTRWRDILDDARLDSAHPLLKAAIAHVAHYQIRNRGTVGGSLAHADPAAEMPGIAVACDADIAVVGAGAGAGAGGAAEAGGAGAARTIHAADFFIAPLVTALAADEIIVEVRLPAWPTGRRWGFQEFSLRRGDFALAAAAVFYDLDDAGRACNAHVGVIGVGDVPQRLAAAEAEINGKVVDIATTERAGLAASSAVNPPDDIHASGAYRRSLVGTMVERALQSARA